MECNSPNESCFAKRIVRRATGRGFADDDMVEKADLHEFGGLDDAVGRFLIGAARAGVAGGVIVNEHESVGTAGDHGAQNFAWMSGGLIDGTDGYDGRAGVAQTGVEGGDDDLFLAEVT